MKISNSRYKRSFKDITYTVEYILFSDMNSSRNMYVWKTNSNNYFTNDNDNDNDNKCFILTHELIKLIIFNTMINRTEHSFRG